MFKFLFSQKHIFLHLLVPWPFNQSNKHELKPTHFLFRGGGITPDKSGMSKNQCDNFLIISS